MDILEIRGLSMRFGNQEVLKGLDMEVPEHSIFGFAGQNGAGKSTTMKIVLGLLKPDRGTVTINGQKVSYGGSRTNRCIGYLPDVPEFYGYMKPMEYLKLCGEITGLSKEKIRVKSGELLELVGLAHEKKKIGGFSRGMKQRLGIARALLHEPKLLICDEPTSALDPIGRKEILDILLAVKGKTTVVFSTHILSDVERVCDRIAVLHKGRLALCGTLQEIRERQRHNGFTIEFADTGDAVRFEGLEALQKTGVRVSRQENILTVLAKDNGVSGHILMGLLAEKQMLPLRFAVLEPTLESLFVEAVQ